jgi:hypothetical protein
MPKLDGLNAIRRRSSIRAIPLLPKMPRNSLNPYLFFDNPKWLE